jgi:undecaprenyl-diphosphatase
MGNLARRLWGRLGQADLLILLAVLFVVGGTLGFVLLADVVREGKTQSLDERILRALRRPDDPAVPVGPPRLGEAGRDLTALGGETFMTLLTAAVVVYLLLCRKYSALALVVAAAAGGLLLSLLLKDLFHRDRPRVVPQLAHVDTTSFPSGHSMNSAIIYLTLGSLLARLTPRRILKIYFISLALLLTFLVGVSRVYMGVHYPTDVLAGWTAGLVWAVGCWLAAQYLQHRGAVDRSL